MIWALATEGRTPTELALDEIVDGGIPPALVLTRAGRPIIDAAHHNSIEVVTVDRLSDHADLLRDRGIDLGVAFAWAELLDAEILEAPPHGWLNAHPAELPAYRGGDPIGWQLVSRPSSIGLTIHEMSRHFDEGPVVRQERLSVTADESRRDVEARAFRAMGRMLADIVRAGPGWERRPQAGPASRCPPVGVTALVNPAYITAEHALGVVRALAYSPGVGIIGYPNLVHAAELGPELAPHERPGLVISDESGVRIACKDRWIKVTDSSKRSILTPVVASMSRQMAEVGFDDP